MLMFLNKNNKNMKFKNNNGYLMIEVLIGLVIFSGALVGLMALQLHSYTSTQSAGYRSVATNYANDLLDKMRANKAAANNKLYSSVTPANNACRSVNFNTTNTAVNCNSTQIAQDDLQEFNNQVTGSLPQGAAVVCIDSSLAQGTPTTPNCDGIGNSYAIKIFWKDSRSKLVSRNSGYSQVVIGGTI